MNDAINRPAHYTAFGETYEPINVVEAWNLNYRLATAVCYIARHELKGDPLQDLRKARWYLDREISKREFALVVEKARKETKNAYETDDRAGVDRGP